LFVHQTKYCKDLLKRARMKACKASVTPCKPHSLVLKNEGSLLTDHTQFHSIVGALQYLTFTRLDIAFAINSVCQFIYVVFLRNNHVSSSSSKQSSVSRSSTEAEYRALANCVVDIAWTHHILQDLCIFIPEAPTLYNDNLSALALSSNPIFYSRIKHLELDFHFIRERVQRIDLIVQYFQTEEQIAGIFTKGIHNPLFIKHYHNLSLGLSPVAIEWG
ncbi:unnamed protein product, partial [Prunus brigantina]